MIRETLKKNRGLFVTFGISLALTIVLTIILSFTASALNDTNPGNGSQAEAEALAANPGAEPVDESVLKQLVGIDGSQTLEIILIVTILSVAPSFLVMLTSFTRIIIVFSFLRNAMQTQSIPPNSVLTGLSLFLTIFVMWPTFTQVNEEAYQPYSKGEISIEEMIGRTGDCFKTFMLKNTSRKNMQFFLDLKGALVYDTVQKTQDGQTQQSTQETTAVTTAKVQRPEQSSEQSSAQSSEQSSAQTAAAETAAAETTPVGAGIDPQFIDEDFIKPLDDLTEKIPVNLNETQKDLLEYTDQLGLETVIPAFIVSELTRAFQMGFMLFIPFLVIDIVVSSTLMAMGMMMLPPSMISLPFKIMLFVLVDGWQLLIGTVVNSFNL